MPLKPCRVRGIVQILTGGCNAQLRSSIMKRGHRFWTSKHAPGKKFLDTLRKCRRDAWREKFKVRGDKRWASRVQKSRIQQLAIGVMDVVLPPVADSGDVIVKMKCNKRRERAVWVNLDKLTLDHIAQMANAFFSKNGVNDIEDERISKIFNKNVTLTGVMPFWLKPFWLKPILAVEQEGSRNGYGRMIS